jgi:hypothetical protein
VDIKTTIPFRDVKPGQFFFDGTKKYQKFKSFPYSLGGSSDGILVPIEDSYEVTLERQSLANIAEIKGGETFLKDGNAYLQLNSGYSADLSTGIVKEFSGCGVVRKKLKVVEDI